jgi:hypothetical protein
MLQHYRLLFCTFQLIFKLTLSCCSDANLAFQFVRLLLKLALLFEQFLAHSLRTP